MKVCIKDLCTCANLLLRVVPNVRANAHTRYMLVDGSTRTISWSYDNTSVTLTGVDIDGTEALTVPSVFVRTLDMLGDGVCTLQQEDNKHNDISVTCDNISSRFACLPTDAEQPVPANIEDLPSDAFRPRNMYKAIRYVLPIVAKSDCRKCLTYLIFNDSYAIGVDGYRMHSYVVADKTRRLILVPRIAAVVLHKVLKEDDRVCIYDDGKLVTISIGRWRITSVVDEDDRNEAVNPIATIVEHIHTDAYRRYRLQIDKALLVRCVRAITKVAEHTYSMHKINGCPVTIRVDDQLNVTFGYGTEYVSVAMEATLLDDKLPDNEPLEIHVNGKYLLAILKYGKGPVCLGIPHNKLDPIHVKHDALADGIVMPTRVVSPY